MHALHHTTDYVHRPMTLRSFSPGGQYILLSFSNGPHHILTPKILDILKHFNAKGNFFIYGQRALHYPNIVLRIVSEGHDIGHQGFYPVANPSSMLAYNKCPNDKAIASISQTSILLQNITNSEVRYFRPPFGLISESLQTTVLKDMQLHNVIWSLDSQDRTAFNKLGEANPVAVSELVLKNCKPGDIVLFHDTQTILLEALPLILQGLFDQGYEILTLSDILKFPDDSPH